MRIVDTHLHLVDMQHIEYPWMRDEPLLQRNFTLEDYLRDAAPAGVEAMLHMEVDVADGQQEQETAWVTALGGQVVGAISGCRPELEGFAAQLERLAANPKVRGLRRTFHFTPDALIEHPLLVPNLRRLAGYGYTFDLCAMPHQLPAIARLVRQVPEVTFILDHCGIPDVRRQALDPWRAHVAELAALPNVVCKISGIVAYGDLEKWTIGDLRPFFDHAVDAFGFGRLVWGSDWPICTKTAGVAGWIEVTHTLLEGVGEGDKTAFLSGNAERIYRLA